MVTPTRLHRFDQQWEDHLSELREYKSRYGNVSVPIQGQHKNLGKWLESQRYAYRKGLLRRQRINILKELGFVFDSKSSSSSQSSLAGTESADDSPPSTPRRQHKFDQQWEARLAELKAYKSLHGDTSVPSNKSEAYGQLGRWCENQRLAYKSGNMKRERIDKLKEIGFVFEANVPRSPEKAFPALDKKWHDRIEELKQFIQTHGHANVPPGYTNNEKLGKWVENVRGKYKNDKLSEEAVEELKEAGFLFNLPPSGSAYRSCTYKDNFEKRVEQLLEYRDEHGNCNVPAKLNEPQGLGKWVENQKSSYRRIEAGREKMTEEKEERFERLKDIGLNFERRGGHGGMEQDEEDPEPTNVAIFQYDQSREDHDHGDDDHSRSTFV